MIKLVLANILIFLCTIESQAQMVDSVYTPYTEDEHTRLLLHFDGSLNAGFDINIQGNYEYIEAEGGQRPNTLTL